MSSSEEVSPEQKSPAVRRLSLKVVKSHTRQQMGSQFCRNPSRHLTTVN